jgi:hypothetical protein
MDHTSGRIDTDITRSRNTAEDDIANRTAPVRVGEKTRAYAADESGDGIEADTKRIRDEIENTRGEMSETIDAIQEKLKPGNIVANATERVKSATTERVRDMADTASQAAEQAMDYGRETADSVVGTARQNPIPLALLGLGAAWWLASRSKSSSSVGRNRDDRGYGREYGGHSTARVRALDEQGAGVIERLRRNPVPAALAGAGLTWLAFSSGERSGKRPRYGRSDEARYIGGNRASEGPLSELSDAAGAVSQVTSRTREYAADAADSVRRVARQRKNQLQRTMEQNPLLVGASALILGAAVGLAVPESDTENEWMGDARDNVVDRARDIARGAANKVEQAAGSMAEEAMNLTEKPQP